jgi:hypothetical protein
VDIQNRLKEQVQEAKLHRPMRIPRYEVGDELTYDVKGVADNNEGRVRLVVEKFVGGGFAGQVYRVKIADIASDGPIGGLEVGGTFAMKILIPPSGFSRFFRSVLYWIGFQGPFQLQVNPAAARAGALWQKFIRRGASVRFGDERSVVDIHATFVDRTLGSCGELSEWIDGRTWRLEVDDRLDLLRRWSRGKPVDEAKLGSPEYRAKYVFMHDFVKLVRDMGAPEFARQYEWSTWKSQPNCLKRRDTEGSPTEGLVAVDFRAGLALLPFLPMSPGDFKLIFMGLMRGSLVQFDRGNLTKLQEFIKTHSGAFGDTDRMFGALKDAEGIYRNSIPDITHNHFRLFCSGRLWSTMLASAITGWKVKNLIGDSVEDGFRRSKPKTLLFALIGIIPLLGLFIRRIWGQTFYRKHYGGMLSSWGYLKRAVRATLLEKTIAWHMSGRFTDERALRASKQIWRSALHLPFSILPVGLDRFLTDWEYTKDRLYFFLIRPFRLYFNRELLEEWLREIVMEGREDHLLSKEDADVILSQVHEPFIQKYLKSLAVHLLTLPITQVVSVIVAALYVAMHPEMPRAQAYGIGLGIIALFQVTPVSPGSLARGLYVVYLVVREKNFKDYNIAVFLGFFKYIGYLAFPIQMAYRYPALARFMAAHWAAGAVHVVPVFGERGAWLEHFVYNMFYNWPLTIRRRMKSRAEMRSTLKPRYWHVVLCALAGSVVFGLADFIWLREFDLLPTLREIWWLVIAVPFCCGTVVTLGAGGASMRNRVLAGAACGTAVGVLYTAISTVLGVGAITPGDITVSVLWRVFLFTMISTLGVMLTELLLPGKE